MREKNVELVVCAMAHHCTTGKLLTFINIIIITIIIIIVNRYHHHHHHHHCGISGVCNGPPPYHRQATRARVSTDQKITDKYKRSPTIYWKQKITNHSNFRILLNQLIKSVLQPPFNQPSLFFHQSQASTSEDQIWYPDKCFFRHNKMDAAQLFSSQQGLQLSWRPLETCS